MKHILLIALIALFVSVFFAFALSGDCKAKAFTPSLNRAYAAAERYWGGPPPNCTTVVKSVVPRAALPENFAARATIPWPDEWIECHLELVWPLAKRSNYVAACAVTIHEMGHLRGFEHDDSPASIMHAPLTFTPAICKRGAAR